VIKVIDSQVFANEGGSLQGELPVAALTRLLDLLAASDGFLKYRIKGQMGPYNRPQFLVEIDGVMSLCCQRCLEAIEHPIEVRSLLEFVDSDGDLTQEELEDDSRDFLPKQKELDIAVLIEDEILLALPIAPRHNDCLPPGAARRSAKVSPFSVLAGLQGKAE